MLTSDEAAVYDRQIRLWGVTAQSKLRKSKILILGFTGLASEIVKTLVLAGVDSITIVDDSPLQDDDLTSNLFCRPNFAAKPSINENGNGNGEKDEETSKNITYRTCEAISKLRLLNPLVKVEIDNSNFEEKPASFYKQFDLVTLHTFTRKDIISRINMTCRSFNIKFYLALDFGFFGAAFSDLGNSFTYSVEEEVSHTSLTSKRHCMNNNSQLQTFSDGEDDDQSDDERPLKKAKIEDQVITTTKDVVEKKLDFVPFEEIFSYKDNSIGDDSVKLSTSPVLPILHLMFEFYSKFERKPSSDSMEDDIRDLNNIAVDVLKHLNLKDNVFNKVPDWTQNVFGSLSPVCAIVGGVIGQDMIRTLSGRDAPICNLFLFDGINMVGVVEKIGAKKMKRKIVDSIDEIVL